MLASIDGIEQFGGIMLLGVRTWGAVTRRHLIVALVAGAIGVGAWSLFSTWSPDMRLWKSFGVPAIGLLWFAVFVGPVARIWPRLGPIVPWRREAGIWFAIVSAVHGYLVWDGWARWDVAGLLGYQLSPESGMYLRAEPGFGLANLIGLVAALLGLALAATSFDRAVAFLGVSSWKWMHTLAYAAFYLVALHVTYFAFIHYSPSPTRMTEYEPNPLRYYYLALLLTAVGAQAAAFVTTVWRRRRVGAL